MLIDPFNVTNYKRKRKELEGFLLFCVCVAGKSAVQQAEKLEQFLAIESRARSPFKKIRLLNDTLGGLVEYALMRVRMGQYSRIGQAFIALAYSGLDLRTCSLEDLTAIPGVGQKTARFFLLHSRRGQRIAVLDTHILRFLKKHAPEGVRVPDKTPPGRKLYEKLEELFLSIADSQGKTPADLDLEIWKASARKGAA